MSEHEDTTFPPEPENRLGERLKELRLRRGLRQVDVAAETDIDQSMISKMERAEEPGYLPPLKYVHRLADFYDVTDAELLAASGWLRQPAGLSKREHHGAEVFDGMLAALAVSDIQDEYKNLIRGFTEGLRKVYERDHQARDTNTPETDENGTEGQPVPPRRLLRRTRRYVNTQTMRRP